MTRVGIPRALLYYQYYPMWKTFFETLGAEVVISSPTSREMLTSGSTRVVADTCLPVKVFLGHVLSLVGKCDYIFIPAVRSVNQRVYNCSKFLGLPDMTRAVIPESPPILDIDIDVNRGKPVLYQSIFKLGQYFTRNPLRIRRAGIAAWQTHLYYLSFMSSNKITPIEAINKLSGVPEVETEDHSVNPTTIKRTIALIGHPYLLYDEYINYRLINYLKKSNCRVLVPHMITPDELASATAELVGEAYWTYEDEVVGAGQYYLSSGTDGIIGIMTFGCGPDSIMMEIVHRQARKLRTIPFMSLTLEEHTSEAGTITRLEAFLDMVHRNKKETVCV